MDEGNVTTLLVVWEYGTNIQLKQAWLLEQGCGWVCFMCSDVYLVAPAQMIFPEDQIVAVIVGFRSFIKTF